MPLLLTSAYKCTYPLATVTSKFRAVTRGKKTTQNAVSGFGVGMTTISCDGV